MGLLFLIFSCSMQKEIYEHNPHLLSFGTSGGFTNQTISFKLFSDGKLWKIRGLQKDSSLLKQLKKSQTRTFFKQAYALGLDTLKYDEPGNMSRFVNFKNNKFNNKVIWSGKNERLDNFYNSLLEITKF
jgi:hypothetical protein